MIEYLHFLAISTDLETVWNRHCRRMSDYGFDRLIYAYSRFVTDETLGDPNDAIILSNHDPAYMEHYLNGGLFAHAPMVRWARENIGACSWGELWNRSTRLSDTERADIAFNRSMNVTAGYSIRFADKNARAIGVMVLTARKGLSQGDVDAVWAANGGEIEVMNHMAHLKILSLPHRTMRAQLTARQREVLEWVGEGKSNQDIATILGVSVATVEKHLRLSREKLGADTTAQAILKAAFLNQIYAS